MGPHVWKLLGGAGLAAVAVFVIVGRSDEVAGEPTDQADTQTQLMPGEHEPGKLYDLGPGAIPYGQQDTVEQANIDRVKAQLEANQPTASHDAYGRAVDQAVVQAQAEIAERKVGLEGVEEQGVVP